MAQTRQLEGQIAGCIAGQRYFEPRLRTGHWRGPEGISLQGADAVILRGQSAQAAVGFDFVEGQSCAFGKAQAFNEELQSGGAGAMHTHAQGPSAVAFADRDVLGFEDWNGQRATLAVRRRSGNIRIAEW